jgi:dihydrofolate reductase/uncharacterized protein YndB with AHSA1/START domain
VIDELRFERLLAAPPARVFELFTRPEGQRAFYGKDEPGWIVESECDLRVGGVWSVAFGPSRDALYRHRHVFQAIEPPRRILLACTERRLDGSTLELSIEFTFEPDGAGTRMTMVQSGFPDEVLREEHGLGVPHAFARFSRVLERSRMSRSVLFMSMSLDGFIAGPDDGPGQGLGRGGERLHDWLGEAGDGPEAFRPSGPSRAVFDEMLQTGAVLVGRHTFDYAGQWGGDHHGVPIFVPTRGAPPEHDHELVHYVTDGVERAMADAKAAAGDADVLVHGAELAQECLRAGVLDELELQLIPVLLGAGRPLFGEPGQPAGLELTRVIDAPGVTHLRYRVTA